MASLSFYPLYILSHRIANLSGREYEKNRLIYDRHKNTIVNVTLYLYPNTSATQAVFVYCIKYTDFFCKTDFFNQM